MYSSQNKKNVINIEKFNSIYYFEFGKDFTHTPESHNFWEMVYVDNGRINAISDGKGFMLEQGQVIFHEPMEVHAHISDKHVANNMMVISFTTQSENMDFFKNKNLPLLSESYAEAEDISVSDCFTIAKFLCKQYLKI